ncbi:hypothetical protein LINPERPRIM_LOCUS30355 [Linum perenne]
MYQMLFRRILEGVVGADPTFGRRMDTTGRWSLSPELKITAALRMLAFDLQKLLCKASQRGFPGMIGSIDCMHWEWRNYPTALAGQFTGHVHRPTVVLDAVAGYNTLIWHAYFGTAGFLNDINILGQSPMFDRVVNGSTPQFRFKVNESWYNTCYYLADGIYPS